MRQHKNKNYEESHNNDIYSTELAITTEPQNTSTVETQLKQNQHEGICTNV